MIGAALKLVVERKDLSREEAGLAMQDILSGQASPVQIAAFLTALRMKGETPDELAGFATTMRAAAIPVRPRTAGLLDTCGTGGDASGSFNVSTATAFVAAGMGIPVAKHGNRSVSSRCGSADVLEALGINIDLAPEQVARCIDEAGIGVLYAPVLHASMRHAAPVRRELGLRSVFNMLGPLTNPAGVKRQLIGAFSLEAARKLAAALLLIGTERTMVVHSAEGYDEISPCGPTHVFDLRGLEHREYTVTPEDAGLAPVAPEPLQGGDAERNAAQIEALLEGEPGPRREAVLLNAAACAVICDRAADFAHGVELARESLDTGAAHAALEAMRSSSRPLRLEVSSDH
jgi:anthranilate phosphoribosyltransferase